MRVYDIVNCGPRKCYVVEGKVVSNCILGIQFGEREQGLALRYPDYFPTKASAKKVIDLVMDLFPGVRDYQISIVRLAQQRHKLITRFGYVRWFWEAMKWSAQRGGWVMGSQAQQAMAFAPANDAFGMKKEVMIKLRSSGLSEKYGLINDMHDALMFCCPGKWVDECCEVVGGMMESPSPVLRNKVAPGGLKVFVDIAVGKNRASMSEWKRGSYGENNN